MRFADLENAVGRDEVRIAAVFYRQASASQQEAGKIVSALGLGPDVAQSLTECPVIGGAQGIAGLPGRTVLSGDFFDK